MCYQLDCVETLTYFICIALVFGSLQTHHSRIINITAPVEIQADTYDYTHELTHT